MDSGGGGICSVVTLPRGDGRTTRRMQRLIILARRVILIVFLDHRITIPLRMEESTELPPRVPYRDLDASSRSPSINIIVQHSERFDSLVIRNDRVFCAAKCSLGRALIG